MKRRTFPLGVAKANRVKDLLDLVCTVVLVDVVQILHDITARQVLQVVSAASADTEAKPIEMKVVGRPALRKVLMSVCSKSMLDDTHQPVRGVC